MTCHDGSCAFVDPVAIDGLYRGAQRLEQRVSTLLGAKRRGRNPIDVVIEQLAPAEARVVVDIGCGLGGATRKLEAALSPRGLIAFDRSGAMLEATRRRVPGASLVQGDFHALPFRPGSVDLVVAAFCLYHSPAPQEVCRGVADCLAPSGVAALVTKSSNSYHEIDHLLAMAGLDRDAPSRPSLYGTFSAENAAEVVGQSLRIAQVITEQHEFHFATPEQLAAYVRTSPKYPIAAGTPADATSDALARVWPVGGLVVTSHVVVVLGGRRS
jgi:ubiquinone/menaquinone biosynthesis C-methylase UbiE